MASVCSSSKPWGGGSHGARGGGGGGCVTKFCTGGRVDRSLLVPNASRQEAEANKGLMLEAFLGFTNYRELLPSPNQLCRSIRCPNGVQASPLNVVPWPELVANCFVLALCHEAVRRNTTL